MRKFSARLFIDINRDLAVQFRIVFLGSSNEEAVQPAIWCPDTMVPGNRMTRDLVAPSRLLFFEGL